ncbi:MAG TPA: hypothetical protein VKU41_32535 [Polyangiaceae bacterium]|nr:hypothetical protein [Polyangiaceae bacterium]
MILHATRKACGIAIAISLCAGGCHDFEAVGVLAVDTDARVVAQEAGGFDVRGDARPEGSFEAGPVVVSIDECQGGSATSLDEATVGALVEGDGGPGVTWLYPYDGTVFPSNLTGPLLMWNDGSIGEDAVYVRMRSSSFDYRLCSKPTAPGQLQFPQAPWALAGAGTAGAADPFSIELRVLTGGRVLEAKAEQVVISAGALSGSVYYQTIGVGLGSISRIQPGQIAQPFLTAIGCVGCHSVSADGSRMIAAVNDVGTAYTLPAAAGSPSIVGSVPGGESPGIMADGTLYVASAHPNGMGPKTYGGAGVMTAGLYETTTGSLVADSGVPTGAMMPAFSRDGGLLVFNDFAIDAGRGLALMDFSEAARTASNYRTLLPSSDKYPAWPSFLPDGRSIVFQLGASSEFSGGGAGILQSVTSGPAGDLVLVDAQTRATTPLSRAMGFASASDAASGNTYLPFGIGESHQNYAPSVSPAATGGYVWLFFDSMRHYGNVGLLRGIWGTAVDVAASGYTADPSHPAFYLPGQGMGTGNFRPVAALDR